MYKSAFPTLVVILARSAADSERQAGVDVYLQIMNTNNSLPHRCPPRQNYIVSSAHHFTVRMRSKLRSQAVSAWKQGCNLAAGDNRLDYRVIAHEFGVVQTSPNLSLNHEL